MPQTTPVTDTRMPPDSEGQTRHSAILTRHPRKIHVETFIEQLDQARRSEELTERDASLARILRRQIAASKSLRSQLLNTLDVGTRLQIDADYLEGEGFNKRDLAKVLQFASQSPRRTVNLTWIDETRDTSDVDREPYQKARQALEDLNQLSFPKAASLSEALGRTEEFLAAVQSLAAEKLGELVRPEEMLDAQFFKYFDALVDRMPHTLLRNHFQRWLVAQKGRTFDSFEVKRELAANIQQRLKRVHLRVQCPVCRVPANFRCVRFGDSKTGQFGFGHRKGRSEDKHSLTTTFPHVDLVPAPKDPRLKVI